SPNINKSLTTLIKFIAALAQILCNLFQIA
ncbi:unnamed protein product, partial [Rotaria sp. Silwood2]